MNWAKNFLFLLVYMLSGGTLVLIIDGLLSGTELIPFNTAIETVLVGMRTPFLTNLMVFITNIGSPFFLACVSVVLAVVLILRKNTYDALLFLISLTVSIASFTILKNTFKITRPGLDLISFSGWSFPSGHATVATAFFFILAHAFFDKVGSGWGKFNLILGSLFGAAVISFSRLYLGAHWALDILAGIALGLLSVSFTVLVFNIFIEEKVWKRKLGS
jgi:membrane-associated phospholipid phosphatase